MKNYTAIFLSLFALLFSCKKSDDTGNYPSKLYGTWEFKDTFYQLMVDGVPVFNPDGSPHIAGNFFPEGIYMHLYKSDEIQFEQSDSLEGKHRFTYQDSLLKSEGAFFHLQVKRLSSDELYGEIQNLGNDIHGPVLMTRVD